VLAKNSGTDYDTEWVDQSGGGSAPLPNYPNFFRAISIFSGSVFGIRSNVGTRISVGTNQMTTILNSVTVNVGGKISINSQSGMSVSGS
jgi:hypothetical protein